jgi:hypothetical protein
MTTRLAALCLVLAAVQETDVGRLSEQLGSEDPARRQQAERRLLEIGEPARPELERVSRSQDAEVGARARAILAKLDREAVRRKFLGPAWKVTVPVGEHLLGDLPGLLKPQVPVPIRIPAAAAGARVKIGADALTIWEFLDRVCDAHGGLKVPLDRPDGAFELIEGKPARAPTSYSGPFRIWIDQLTLEESSGWRGVRLVYGIAWQPNVDPMSQTFHAPITFEVREATDASGKELKIEPERSRSESSYRLDRTPNGAWRYYVDLAPPPAGVRRWGRIKGVVTLEFPLSIVQVDFKDPTRSGETSVQAGNTTITLDECRRDDRGVHARLRFRRTWNKEDAAGESERMDLRSRFREAAIVLRGEKGGQAVFDIRSSSHSSSDEEETHEVKGFGELREDVRSLTFPFIAETFQHEAPFEFRNVDVP